MLRLVVRFGETLSLSSQCETARQFAVSASGIGAAIRFWIFDCRFLIERRPAICNLRSRNLRSPIKNSKLKIQNPHDALPLAEGKGQLEHVDSLTGEQVRDDVVDGSEEPVCAGSAHQDIILAGIV